MPPDYATTTISASTAEVLELAQISDAMRRVYSEQFGREPGSAESYYVGADKIVCFLLQTLTRAERRLTTMDEHQRLRDMRMLFQYSAESEFRQAVEIITGRDVIAFISGIDTRTDIASELFLLEPVADSSPRRVLIARRLGLRVPRIAGEHIQRTAQSVLGGCPRASSGEVLIEEAVGHRVANEFCASLEAQFLHDVSAVGLGSADR